jgi:hypothetical protein
MALGARVEFVRVVAVGPARYLAGEWIHQMLGMEWLYAGVGAKRRHAALSRGAIIRE